MTTPLPPYSGPEAQCSKCQHEGCSTAHRQDGQARAGDFFAVLPAHRVERLERRCPNCGYQWDEATATPTTPGGTQ